MTLKILIGEYEKVETFFMLEEILDDILPSQYLEECWLQFLCRLGEIDQSCWDKFKETFSTFKPQNKIVNEQLLEQISGEIRIVNNF